jgi:pyruvate dehydrogenase E1 component
MLAEQEDVFYYVTLLNENYRHPAMPEGTHEGILRGMYLVREAGADAKAPRVQLIGAGAILREALAAADLLQALGVAADVWSATSYTLVRRDGDDTARWNMLHPETEPRRPYVARLLEGHPGPVVAASDYVKLIADQIRPYVDRPFHALGTDGFGRSDTRAKLRGFFEVDRHWIAVAALHELAEAGTLPRARVAQAMREFGLDPEKPNPVTV